MNDARVRQRLAVYQERFGVLLPTASIVLDISS